MRKLFFIAMLFFTIKVFANVPSQNEVRSLFHYSAIKEDSCKKLVSILQNFTENNNALMAGYKACATMIMAKYVFNPFSKLSNFFKGKNLLEKSIQADKQNIELRFLRFTIQNNVPAFLGYKSEINQDKIFLINGILNLKDQQLKQMIISFLKNSVYLTSSEKQNLL